MEWIDKNTRMPKEEDTCKGRVVVLDVDGYAMIGLLIKDKIFCEVEYTHWAPLQPIDYY